MEVVTVVDVKPQLIAGISKRAHYREIAELLPKLYEHEKKEPRLRLPQHLCVMKP